MGGLINDMKRYGKRVKKYTTEAIGDGAETVFNIVHNFNDLNVICKMRDTNTQLSSDAPVVIVEPNRVILEFVSAPSASQYVVFVIG